MRNLITGISICLGLVWLAQGLASGQETMHRTEIRNGKVVYVAPGTIAVRGKDGVRIFTRADWKDIKVEKDGKLIDPDQLHKGDYVNATVFTMAEPKTPTAEQMATYGIAEEAGTGDMAFERVIWTEIKRGKVEYVSQTDLLIRGSKGVRRFTKDDWKNTKVEKDGQMIDPSELHTGDVVTATFITTAMPAAIADSEVVTYKEPAPAPKPAPVAAKPAPAPAPVAAPAPAPAPEPVAQLPKTATSLPEVGIAGITLLGLGLSLAAARRLRRA